jgi:hypothetical protein
MGIRETDKIDFMSIRKNGAGILLTIADDMEWADPDHLWLLQEKLNKYIACFESGELFELLQERSGKQFPADTPVTVEIVAKYEPDDGAKAFFQRVESVLREVPMQFSYRVLQSRSAS